MDQAAFDYGLLGVVQASDSFDRSAVLRDLGACPIHSAAESVQLVGRIRCEQGCWLLTSANDPVLDRAKVAAGPVVDGERGFCVRYRLNDQSLAAWREAIDRRVQPRRQV